MVNMWWSGGVQCTPGWLIGQYGGSSVQKQNNRHDDKDDQDDGDDQDDLDDQYDLDGQDDDEQI